MSASSYRDLLIENGLLIPAGVDGVYGTSHAFETLIDKLDVSITQLAAGDDAETMRFPPTLARRTIEASGYVQSSPHLLGTVHTYREDEQHHLDRIPWIAAHDARWTHSQTASDVVLTPAACYPVYPVLARRGRLPNEGSLIDVCSYCFRSEPSADPARMQAFRMREFVRLGSRENVLTFRQLWLARAVAWCEALGLTCRVAVANDPFFGEVGEILAGTQRADELKYEIQIPCGSETDWRACVSLNWHRDHFGRAFGIEAAAGQRAETGCVAFGLERIALALIYRNGPALSAWMPRLAEPLRTPLQPAADEGGMADGRRQQVGA